MLNEAERLELKTKATLLLCDVIFDEGVVQQIKQHRNLLMRFTIKDPKVVYSINNYNYYCHVFEAERHLLGGIEQLISRNKDALLAKTPVILKALYDLDIVSEEALKQWSKKVRIISNIY
jgi:translation initiation factor 5